MPVNKLLVVQAVDLIVSMRAIISREGTKTYCHGLKPLSEEAVCKFP